MQITYKDIIVVMVVYNVKIENALTFISLNNFVKTLSDFKIELIVYDNSESSQNIRPNDFKHWNITYIHDEHNPGVSKAYNVASEIAFQRGHKWMLLTDQDTDFPEDAINTYIDQANNYNQIKLFVPILKSKDITFSPCKYYFSKGFIWKNPAPGIYSFKNKSILNSGIFVNIKAFRLIGGYNEKIKLYFSDFDFVQKFKKQYDAFCIIDIICKHELSDVIKVELESAIRRFNSYCQGSFESRISKLHFLQLFITIFLRSIKLSITYKNSQFILIFFKYYLR